MIDHIFYQIGCDYNMYPLNNAYNPTFGNGPWTLSKKCFMQRDPTEIQIDYIKQFWSTYKDKRKFFTMRNEGVHNIAGETGRYVDEELVKLL